VHSQFNPERFELVILDQDRMLFSIEGPMSNDSKIWRRIAACHTRGRHLSCLGPVNETVDRAAFIAQIILQTRADFVNDVFKLPRSKPAKSTQPAKRMQRAVPSA